MPTSPRSSGARAKGLGRGVEGHREEGSYVATNDLTRPHPQVSAHLDGMSPPQPETGFVALRLLPLPLPIRLLQTERRTRLIFHRAYSGGSASGGRPHARKKL